MLGRLSHSHYQEPSSREESPPEHTDSPPSISLPQSEPSTPSIETDSPSFRELPISPELTQGYRLPTSHSEAVIQGWQPQYIFTPDSTEASQSLSSNLLDSSASQSKKSSPSPPKAESTDLPSTANPTTSSTVLNLPLTQTVQATTSFTPKPITNPIPNPISNPTTNPISSSTAPKPKSTSTAMPIKTISELPIPGSKNAPKKFTGKYSRAKRFTDHVKKLFVDIPLVSGEQKCETLLEHCSTKVAEFLERLNSVKNHDFEQLIKDIHLYYDADLAESKWKEKDLMSHIKEYRRSKIKTLSEWKAYNRRFIRIADWLKDKSLIDENHYKTYFWDGINKDLQTILETRILSANPNHDFSKPYDVDTVQKVANRYFQRDRFASLIVDSDDSDSDSESFESTDSEDSTSSDESDDDKRKKKKKRKKLSSHGKYHAKTSNKMDNYRKKIQAIKEKDEGTGSKKDTKKSEVDDLIEKLQNMSIDHPSYGIAYYRAIVLDSRLKDCLKKPQIQGQPQTEQSGQYAKRFKAGQRVFQVSQAPQLDNDQSSIQIRPLPSGSIYVLDDRCYGCGGRGHGIRSCQKITELLNAGVIQKNESNGHITMYTGEYIKKQQGESLADAAIRISDYGSQFKGHANYATITPSSCFYNLEDSDDSDTESNSDYDEYEEYDEDDDDEYEYADEYNEELYEEYEEDEEEHVGYTTGKLTPLSNKERATIYMEDTGPEEYELAYNPRDRVRIYAANPQEFTGGPERITRQTRSTRQTKLERPSEVPRGQTDAKKKQKEVPASTADKAPSYVPKAVKEAAQSTSKVNEPVRQSAQPANQSTKYPTGPKPYVDVPTSKWTPRPPASESYKEIRTVRNNRDRQAIQEQNEPIPVQARKQRIVQESDIDMEEVPVKIRTPKKQSRARYQEDKENVPTLQETYTEPKAPKRQARKSELSSKINDSQVISKLLDVQIPIKLSEILAVSPRVANTVSDMMKPRNQATLKTPAPVYRLANMPEGPQRSLTYRSGLIKVLFSTCGKPLRAIVDTGSQLNVVDKRLCGTVIQQPTNCTRQMKMTDAGGGETPLTGLIEHVPLSCGGVSTVANLYVGEDLPFDLLLGRPWQKGNMVSIDERKNGTYLVFKDPKTEQPKHELLVDKAGPMEVPISFYDASSLVLSTSGKPKFPLTENQLPNQSVTSASKDPRLNLDEQTGMVKFDGNKIAQSNPLETDYSGTSASISQATNLLLIEKGNQNIHVPIVLQENRFMSTKNVPKNPKIFQNMCKLFAEIMGYAFFINVMMKIKLGIFSVYKENCWTGKKRPPKDPSTLRNMSPAIMSDHSKLVEVPYPSSTIKPLNQLSQSVPKDSDFISRITSANIALSGAPGNHPLSSTNFLITSQNHVPQVEDATANYLLHGACLGAGLYQDDQASGERTCMLGNLTYTFQPIQQLFYQGKNNGTQQQQLVLGNGACVPNLDATLPNPVCVSCKCQSQCDSTTRGSLLESTTSTPSSMPSLLAGSTTTAKTAGHITVNDVHMAQDLVEPHIFTYPPTPSSLYDEYINFENKGASEPPIATIDKYELIKKFSDDYAADPDSDSDDSSMYDELDDLSASFSIASTPFCLQTTAPPPTPTRKERDDTPHPVSGKFLFNYADLYKPNYEEHDARPITQDDANTLYDYAARAKKEFEKKEKDVKMERDDEQVPSGNENFEQSEKETGTEPWCVARMSPLHKFWTHTSRTDSAIEQSEPIGPRKIGTTAPPYAPTRRSDIMCRAFPPHPTCQQLAELFKSHDNRSLSYNWGIPVPDLTIKPTTDCCEYAPHTLQEARFQQLEAEIRINAYTRDKCTGVYEYTNYLYNRGGGELLVKEASKLRGAIENYLSALLQEVTTRKWKPREGSIRPRCFRRIPGYDGPVFGHHYVVSQELIPNYYNAKNNLLSNGEEAALLALHDIYADQKCSRTARRIVYLINLKFQDSKLLQAWNSFGLLDARRLLQNRNIYYPQPLVEIGDWEDKPYIDEFTHIY